MFINTLMKTYFSRKRLKTVFCLAISNLPMPGHAIRPLFVKWSGVKIIDYKHTFIGADIDWDTVNPEKIIIETGVRITARTIILTHFIDPKTGNYTSGEVWIKKNAFIGA